MTRKQKRILYRILITAVLFLVAELLPVTGWLRLVVFLKSTAEHCPRPDF